MTTLRLNGDWVGEGVFPSATRWQLHVQDMHAVLAQFNTDWMQPAARFDCRLADTPATFTFGEACDELLGHMLDGQHLVIAGLADGADVIFSRPGLAELTMQDAYNNAAPSTQAHFALTRWAIA